MLLSESFADATIRMSIPHPSAAVPVEPGGAELPAGTVTFLLTDIEGSTRLWETEPEAMEVALERHNRLLADVIEEHGGVVVISRGEGDSFFAVFPSAVSAVEAAGDCQLRLGREAWPTECRAAGADGAAHRRGADARRRSSRSRADQPLRPGEGGRSRRAGAAHQDDVATWWRAGSAAGLG